MINVSKTGNTESFSKIQFIVHRTEYKVDSFNLYIIENYVKGLLEGVNLELSNFLRRNH